MQLELSVDRHRDYHPGEVLKLQLHTDSAALVALGAVDMALYAAGGRAHKPLDMGKVCEDPLPPSLVLSDAPQLPARSAQPPSSCGLGPYFPTVCVSHLSIPPSPTASAAPQPSCLCNSPAFSCQVFEVMNSYDLGCGPGGGDSALQVFEAAGLAFSDGHRWTSARNSESRGGSGLCGGGQSEGEGPEGWDGRPPTRAWLQPCSLPGLSCPKKEKTRKKRNVNFQKAISEKCELRVLRKLLVPPGQEEEGSASGLLCSPGAQAVGFGARGPSPGLAVCGWAGGSARPPELLVPSGPSVPGGPSGAEVRPELTPPALQWASTLPQWPGAAARTG